MVSTIKKVSAALIVAAFATIMFSGYIAANTNLVYAWSHHHHHGGFGFGFGGGCCGSCGGCGINPCNSCGGFWGNNWNWGGLANILWGNGWNNCFC